MQLVTQYQDPPSRNGEELEEDGVWLPVAHTRISAGEHFNISILYLSHQTGA